jgi:hypothetical protein
MQKMKDVDSIKNIESTEKGKYIINIENPSYISNKHQRIFFIDYDSGAQLSFNEVKSELKPEELDLIVGQKIISELTKGVMNNAKEKITWFIMGLIFGILLALVIMQIYYGNKIEEMYKTESESTIVLPTIPSIAKMGWRVFKFH